MSSRGIAPVVGVALLLLVTLGLSGAFAVAFAQGPETGEPKSFRLSVATVSDDSGWQIELTHEGGSPVEAEEIDIRIKIDGVPLKHQPRVPSFGMAGFNGGASGPFNIKSADNTFEAGDSATIPFPAASTNEPLIDPDSIVTVSFYHNDVLIARASTVHSP